MSKKTWTAYDQENAAKKTARYLKESGLDPNHANPPIVRGDIAELAKNRNGCRLALIGLLLPPTAVLALIAKVVC